MTRPALSLAPQRCDKCMRCLRVCPLRAIEAGASFVFVDWSRCDGCGRCVDVCEPGALAFARGRGPAPVASAHASRDDAVTPASAPAVPAASRPRLRVVRDDEVERENVKAPRLDDIAPLAPSWGTWDTLAVLAGVALLFTAEQLAIRSDWMTRVVPMGAKPLMRSGIMTLYYAVQLALLAALGYRKRVGFAEAFGLRRFRVATTALAVIGLVTVARLFTLAYAVGMEWVAQPMPGGPSADMTLYFGRDAVGLVLTVVMIVLVGPFFEELVFRGVLVGYLQERVGAWPAVVFSALIFAAFHVNAWMFVPVALMGLAAGWIAVRSRSLWAAYALHLLYNAVPVFFVFALGK